jgi:hypothetical protein
MSEYIPDPMRKAVAERAAYRCEYCRRPEADSFIKFHIDHIISLKHGGATVLDNLAFSCSICNGNKGSNVGTVLQNEEVFVQLFHPRKHNWFDHFDMLEGVIYPKSEIAEATIKVLELNHLNRILERLDLIAAGLFPK